jgi:hypothetical protein
MKTLTVFKNKILLNDFILTGKRTKINSMIHKRKINQETCKHN